MQRVAASFRDPSGFVFTQAGIVYRSIAPSYFVYYDHLMGSGLYDILVQKKLLVSHQEELNVWTEQERRIIPTTIPFITYPFEWSFSQLKDAALLTLQIQKEALEYGMTLKDASAYNVQFFEGRALFIDTLSFEEYQEGKPWVAYKQFCEHFLAPLALMAYKDIRLSCLLKQYLDGIPLNLASRLLPVKTYVKLGLLVHIHLHAYAQKKYETSTKTKERKGSFTHKQFLGLLDSLQSTIKGCDYKPVGTEWADYYQDDSYTAEGFVSKQSIIRDFLRIAQPKTVVDLGANDGAFSRLATQEAELVVSADYDVACVEKNYRKAKEYGEKKILPLVIDVMNPSPACGWAQKERQGLTDRIQGDCVMALALVHHIALSHNVPLQSLAEYFRLLTKEWLIIEFVPKSDKKVHTLLATRKDIFDHYTVVDFEQACKHYFSIVAQQKVKDSERLLYLMRRKG